VTRGVYGLYRDPDAAQLAVSRLHAIGVPDRDITVISNQPYEEYDFSKRDKPTWMYWIAGAGGALGLAFGIWLTVASQRAWPLPTGGMPIVAPWTTLVVLFELTMLFAILATVATMLVTSRLPRRRGWMYDSQVSDGYLLVGVERDEATDELQRALAADGLGQVKTIDRP
jgi:hypothetical protein